MVTCWIMLVDMCIYLWILSDNRVVSNDNCLFWYLFYIKLEIIEKVIGLYIKKDVYYIIRRIYQKIVLQTIDKFKTKSECIT